MADPRDERVSSAYRELPGDGPTPALDTAIQAAARRAVGARPGGARRWQIPVSIAAVLALAVGISLQVDREKPMVADGEPVSSGSAEYPVAQPEPEKEVPPAPVLAKEAPGAKRALENRAAGPREAKQFTPDPPRAEPPAPALAPVPASSPAPVQAPAAAPMPAPAPAAISAPPAAAGGSVSADAMRAAPQAARRAKAEPAGEATIQEKSMSQALATPERRLERIAELRAKGLHDEADRELAEFRRAFPDYRLTDEWRRKVSR